MPLPYIWYGQSAGEPFLHPSALPEQDWSLGQGRYKLYSSKDTISEGRVQYQLHGPKKSLTVDVLDEFQIQDQHPGPDVVLLFHQDRLWMNEKERVSTVKTSGEITLNLPWKYWALWISPPIGPRHPLANLVRFSGAKLGKRFASSGYFSMCRPMAWYNFNILRLRGFVGQ